MRVLIVDDFEEMRDLLDFVFASEWGFQTALARSGNEAIALLEKDPYFDLIVCDMNMPSGTGQDVFRYHSQKHLPFPFILLSGDPREKYPDVHGPHLNWVRKPFDVNALGSLVRDVTRSANKTNESYVPVSFPLLQQMHNIGLPLFLKINDHKYVKLTNGPSIFDEIDLEKYEARGVRYLYIESAFAEEFISAYQKKVLSLDAWSSTTLSEADQVSINTELLLNLSASLGWGTALVDLARHALQKALVLAKSHQPLSHVFTQFHKIERYGFSDHCTLSMLVSCGLLKNMGYADEMSVAKMTFAALLHDMNLTDDLYQQKPKLMKRLAKGEKRNHDLQVVFEHPAAAAELCRSWDFCPPGVEQIVLNHHERPDGSGFPIGRKAADLDFMTAVFIVSEDFSDYFIEAYGKPNFQKYLDSRRPLFNTGHFVSIFKALEQAIPANKAA